MVFTRSAEQLQYFKDMSDSNIDDWMLVPHGSLSDEDVYGHMAHIGLFIDFKHYSFTIAETGGNYSKYSHVPKEARGVVNYRRALLMLLECRYLGLFPCRVYPDFATSGSKQYFKYHYVDGEIQMAICKIDHDQDKAIVKDCRDYRDKSTFRYQVPSEIRSGLHGASTSNAYNAMVPKLDLSQDVLLAMRKYVEEQVTANTDEIRSARKQDKFT